MVRDGPSAFSTSVVTRTPCRALDFIGRGVDPDVFFDTLVQEFLAEKGVGSTDRNYIL